MLASFHFDGRRSVSCDVLNIKDNTGAVSTANSFIIFTLTESDPCDLLMFKPLSFFSMVAASKVIIRLLSVKVFSSIFHIFSPSIVKTLFNRDANASVLS